LNIGTLKQDQENRNENRNLKKTFEKTTKREETLRNTKYPEPQLSLLGLLEPAPDLSQVLSRWEKATSR